MSDLWRWAALFLLGAYHGINPGMGWLFAVALGLQEKARGAVLRALLPIALGHSLSIGAVLGLLAAAQLAAPQSLLRVLTAAILIGFGVFRLLRSRHPRWVGMRVGFRDLTFWSFLMASAHGAGLMLAPIILGWPHQEHAIHALHFGYSLLAVPAVGSGWPAFWLMPVAIHTLGYLMLTATIALIVYEKLGLAILRQAWVNLDLVWSVALIATGFLTLFL